MMFMTTASKHSADADLYKPDAGLTVWVPVRIDDPGQQCKDENNEKRDEYDCGDVSITGMCHGPQR